MGVDGGAVEAGPMRYRGAAGFASRVPGATEWQRCAVLGVAVLCVVLPARIFYGYPWCVSGNDELFWRQIIESRFDGIYYPTSGHAFVWVAQSLVSVGGYSASLAVSLIGAVSAPLACIGVYLIYRVWLPAQAFPCLMLLAATAYFWAPLIESKPQQWGQPLVLLGAMVYCRWLVHRTTSWWWLLGLTTILAMVHSLSFAILSVACGLVWLFRFSFAQSHFGDGLRGAFAFAPGALLIAWPDGPYAVSMQVIWDHHILAGPSVLGVLALSVVGILALVAMLRMRVRRGGLLRLATHLLEREQSATRTLGVGVLIGLVVCLALQAFRLPADYWGLYGNSPLQFLLAQSGNLLFLALALKGIFAALPVLLRGGLNPDLCDASLLCFVCGGLALVGLGISFWMLDDNWFLRITSYMVMFAAPLAIHGLEWDRRLPSIPIRIALCIGALVSVLLALRWSAFITC